MKPSHTIRLAFTPDEILDWISKNDLNRLIENETRAVTGSDTVDIDTADHVDHGIDWLDGDPVVWFEFFVTERSMLEQMEDHRAHLADLDIVFPIGGAQAIAAMTFGTATIPRVDKLFGPGNRYVTEAKMQAIRHGVAIDIPAGPSEVVVLADDSASAAHIASDLLAQAEHGRDSHVLLVSNSVSLVDAVVQEVEKQLLSLPRADLARETMANSLAIVVEELKTAMQLVNNYAPEHLILSVNNPSDLIDKVVNAGSVFIGHYTPESLGDYASGTNHTLPTSGWARSTSGVSLPIRPVRNFCEMRIDAA